MPRFVMNDHVRRILSRVPALVFTSLACAPLAGCGGESLPDPKDAVSAYASAASKGDADAIYAMLSEKSQRGLSKEDVRRIVGEEKGELEAQAKALASPGITIKSRARVKYPDGEEATLELEGGAFRISAADALPAGAKTPAQALEQLRRVLARRSYAGLMRVLSPSTRSAIENDLRSLVLGLENPEGLEVQVAGDRATVQIPGGHEVKLRREAGEWHVEDFD